MKLRKFIIIDEVNTQLPEGQFLKKDPETPLHGEDSNIDSLQDKKEIEKPDNSNKIKFVNY